MKAIKSWQNANGNGRINAIKEFLKKWLSPKYVYNSIKNGPIFVGEYPYTYVRGLYMINQLIKKEDYHKLLKMSLPEITKYLEDSLYKEEIDKLALKYSGVALLENAFNQNTVRNFQKLRKISPKKINMILDAYLRRMDMHNVKTIIRGKFTGMNESAIREVLLPLGELDSEKLGGLIRKENISGVLMDVGFLDKNAVEQVVLDFEKTHNIFEIENFLDKEYYKFIFGFSKRIKMQGKKFREFLQAEIIVANILILLRLKKLKMNNDEISRYVIFTDRQKTDAILRKLVSLQTINEVIDGTLAIDKLLYGELKRFKAKDGNNESGNADLNLIELELSMKRYLLRKTLVFQNKYPLSVDIIFGYLLGKEMEVRNLGLIVKGKRLGLDTGFLEEHLIV